MTRRWAYSIAYWLMPLTLAGLLAGLKMPRKAWAQKPAPAPLLLLTDAKAGRRIPADPAIRQSRPVAINWTALQQADPQHKETLALSLPLPDGKTGTVRLEKVERRSPTRYSWFGHLENLPESQVILTVEGDALALSIRTANQIYGLRFLGNGVYLLCDLDARQMGRCGTVSPPGLPRPAPDKKIGVQATAIIDMIVLHTTIARNAAGGVNQIRATCQQAVDAANAAYTNSQVNAALRLIHIQEIDYNESGTFDNHLARLTTADDGVMDQVHDLRDLWGADLVSLIVEDSDGGGLCGLAWVMNNNSPSFAPFGFSIVNRGCAVDNLSFAHEVGHNLGCGHDRNDATGTGLYSYSRGRRFIGGDSVPYRTVMATGPNQRIGRFSSPNVFFQGVATGIAEGNADSADNAQTLNETVGSAERFREKSSEVYVDFGAGNGGNGTRGRPFNRIEDGEWRVAAGGTVWVRGNSPVRLPRLTKWMTLRNYNGTALIR